MKTRLAAHLGGEAALEAYRDLLDGVLSRLGGTAGWSLNLAVTPDDAIGEAEVWPTGVLRQPQGGGDLGARLERALVGASRVSPVVVVGSDVPGITALAVRRVLDALARTNLVLGPSPDGGYWAIGMSRAAPEGWLDGVRWSTPHAREDTLARSTAAGLATVVLDLWLEDVDDLDSYRRWRAGC